MPTDHFVIGFVLILAVVDWIAVAKNWKRLEYIAKPGVILALIASLLVNGGYQGQLIFFLLGLVFSLAGDIFLMLPNEKFIAALVSFLLAHIVYILGFSNTNQYFSVTGLILLILVGLTAFALWRRISNSLRTRQQEKLLIPVSIYSLVICIMLISALLTLVGPNSEWRRIPSLLVSIGAILFFISDSLLAWDKFITPVSNGKLYTISTYHLSQITITLGAGLNFLY